MITEYSAGLNPGSGPQGIAPGPDGNLWFTDAGAHAIGQITPSGLITEYSAGLEPGSEPEGIAPGPDGNLWFTDAGATPAIGRITPSGMITEYTTGLGPRNMPTAIAAGPDGNLWFTDSLANAIGRVTPSGQITEYPNGLGRSNGPDAIAPGADGDMWFADTGADAIGRIGTGAPPALHTPATVTGAGQEGSPVACQAQWTDWAGYTARTGLYPFDGYTWQRDGNPIPGQTTATYTPTAADVGHQLGCRLTVTYPLPFSVTATATSPADHRPVRPAPTPDAGALGAGHHAPDVHAYRAPGRGAVPAVEPLGPRRALVHPAGRAEGPLHTERGRDRDVRDRARGPGADDARPLHRTHPRRPPPPPAARARSCCVARR